MLAFPPKCSFVCDFPCRSHKARGFTQMAPRKGQTKRRFPSVTFLSGQVFCNCSKNTVYQRYLKWVLSLAWFARLAGSPGQHGAPQKCGRSCGRNLIKNPHREKTSTVDVSIETLATSVYFVCRRRRVSSISKVSSN